MATVAVTALDADADRRPCAVPSGYHAIATGKRAVVMRHTRRPRHVYACLFAKDEMVRLSGYSPIYRVAGRFVAYRDYFGDESRGGPMWNVYVADLRRGGRLLDADAVYTHTGTRDDGSVPGTVTDMVLKPNGSVAWISCATGRAPKSPCRRARPLQVWRADLQGHAIPDRSRRIGPHSLRLRRNGSRIAWRHGARTRHARLK